ncbi:hypothetical protein FQN57_003901 [Myotisia sp. PD_48]|nr:hypothetical protein FQN57_003901 [Myotisia sp. PD_48]
MGTAHPHHVGVVFEPSLKRSDSMSSRPTHLPTSTTTTIPISQPMLPADIFSPTIALPLSNAQSSVSYTMSPVTKPPVYDSRSPPTGRLGSLDTLSGALNAANGAGPTAIRMRGLPRNTSYEALRSMLLFAKDLVDAEFVPNEYPDEPNYLTAVALFETREAAAEAQGMLNGKPNSTNEVNMIVEVLSVPPPATASAMISRRNTIDHIPRAMNMLPQTSPRPYVSPRIMNRLEEFHSLETTLENSISNHPPSTNGELPAPDQGSRLHTIFVGQSSSINGMHDLPRISGKFVIDQDIDEETGELLKDPVAYARGVPPNTMNMPRRSTNPQLPISPYSSLSLATNMSPSIQQFSSGSSARNVGTPTSAASSNFPSAGPGTPYHQLQFHRLNYPPVNPADQNPPCNTLYVGNLPPDTSEDELKALFSRQRGYKRMIFRQKPNGPICFVEFEDISFATKCLTELYGYELSNSVKGGIRLSFSKNPLGVRNGQPGSIHPANGMNAQGNMNAGNGSSGMGPVRFSTANGPPPGLSAPPGLPMPMSMPNGNGGMSPQVTTPNSGPLNNPFSVNGLGIGMAHNGNNMIPSMRPAPPPLGNNMINPVAAGSVGAIHNSGYPDYMMGR